MNTKEAYEKYGKWAVIAGQAAYLRHDGFFKSGVNSFARALHEHSRWETAQGRDDGDYLDELPTYFARYARSRPNEH